MNKRILTFALAAIAASSFSQNLVSAFDFRGQSLAPYVDENPPHVLPLDYRTGGSSGTSSVTPTYVEMMVGAQNKFVVNATDKDDFFRAHHGLGANGGGSYVALYSILMDVNFRKVTGDGLAWAGLFNTNHDQLNDADTFIRWDGEDAGGIFGSIGISGQYGGKIYANRWNRIIISADLTVNRLDYYLDGVLVHSSNVSGGVEGRWALYPYTDGFHKAVDIMGDNNGETVPYWMSEIAFFDNTMTAELAANLGVAGDPVPEPASMAALCLGALALLRRRRVKA